MCVGGGCWPSWPHFHRALMATAESVSGEVPRWKSNPETLCKMLGTSEGRAEYLAWQQREAEAWGSRREGPSESRSGRTAPEALGDGDAVPTPPGGVQGTEVLMPQRVPLTPQLASTLRDLRRKAGLSQYTLAEKTGLTRPKIKRIERGEIETVAGADYDALVRVLGPTKGRRGRRQASNGKPEAQKDKKVQAEVDRRVRASVLTVMRKLVGDSARTLVKQHGLHDVTLGELFELNE